MTTKSGVKAAGAAARKTTDKPASTSKPASATKPAAAKKPATRKPAAKTGSVNGAQPATSATKPTRAKAPAAKSSAAKSPAKATPSRSAAAGKSAPAKAAGRTSKTRSAAETEKIRVALNERLVELRTEYESMMAQLTDLQRDRLTDSAGDDQADTGTKTFEREQEISLANGIRDRMTQVERALERLDGGHYGYCERCGNPIPAERLAAFPSATLCVSCKQLEERR